MMRVPPSKLCCWAFGLALVGGAVGADRPRFPAAATTKPPATATKPAAPPATAPAPVGRVTLAGGLVSYAAPPGEWESGTKDKTPNRDTYFTTSRKGLLVVEVLPAGQKYGPDLGKPILDKLKQNKRLRKQTYLEEPRVEPDARFALRIRERYRMNDTTVAEQLHLYRQVGPRAVLVMVTTLTDGDAAKEQLAAGEAVSLSAEPVKPAAK